MAPYVVATVKHLGLDKLCFHAVLLLHFLSVTFATVHQSTPQSYVVYMGSCSSEGEILSSHFDRLTSVFKSSTVARDSLIYSYRNFDAFAARLTPEQAASLAAQEGVISVFPSRPRVLHTTHSWAYLGLEDNFGKVTPDSLWNKSDYGRDVIIGVLDTGVWPESEAFNDAGLGPIPAKWKGECTVGELFGPSYCNNKLIGGQFFIKGYEAQNGPVNSTFYGEYREFRSARDGFGHGTNCAAVAGGNFDPGANCRGFAYGTAKGGAPMARIAMYKACWLPTSYCYDADIVAAIDKAISDGVDVLSVSLGPSDRDPLTKVLGDAIALGAFHAIQRNISVVAAAGNLPAVDSVTNGYPWMTTVGASSIDRDFPTTATLGNGVSINGANLAEGRLMDQFYPLVSGADVPAFDSNSTVSASCLPGTLDPAKVSGTIVACQGLLGYSFFKHQEVQNAGGIGMILTNNNSNWLYQFYTLPAAEVTVSEGLKVFSYINSTQSPVAKISGGRTILGVKPAPKLGFISAQGPNLRIPDILKPDITAPGMNILTASVPLKSLTFVTGDDQLFAYTVSSGTSWATPHVAGVIASLKAYRPTWSPAALHSAVVTTARNYDNAGERIKDSDGNATTPFGVGGGEVNPNGAAEPGLVYDNPPSAYLQLLCSLGYNETDRTANSGTNYSCPAIPASVSDFNYPSLTVSNLSSEVIVKRTVTNVGNPSSTYTVSIESPAGINTTISPSVLTFTALGEEKSFTVTMTRSEVLKPTDAKYVFGSFTWSDGTYHVRSPVVVGSGSPDTLP